MNPVSPYRILLALLAALLALPVLGEATQAQAATGTFSGTLREAARSLPVAAEVRNGYDRDKFHLWIDADHDGCDTRNEVLIAEAVTDPTVGSSCTLTGGRWFSYYDRLYTTDPSSFDIDHMVPLAEAWDSGARTWTSGTRELYANDLGDRRALVAVTAHANRSKSDRDPAEWLPTYSKCRYVRQWVAVKIRWHLTVDRAEKQTVVTKADSCANVTLTVKKATVVQSG